MSRLSIILALISVCLTIINCIGADESKLTLSKSSNVDAIEDSSSRLKKIASTEPKSVDQEPRKKKISNGEVADVEVAEIIPAPVRKSADKVQHLGNHTKKFNKLKGSELNNSDSESSKAHVLKASEDITTETKETIPNLTKKTNEVVEVEKPKPTKKDTIETPVDTKVKDETLQSTKITTEKQSIPAVSSKSTSTSSEKIQQSVPIVNIQPEKDSLTTTLTSESSSSTSNSSQPETEDVSFHSIYYFSAFLFVILCIFAYFFYRFLFKPSTPPPSRLLNLSSTSSSTTTTTTTTSNNYQKLPQTDLEMSSSTSLMKPEMESSFDNHSEWEEWDGDTRKPIGSSSHSISSGLTPHVIAGASLTHSISASHSSHSHTYPSLDPSPEKRPFQPPVVSTYRPAVQSSSSAVASKNRRSPPPSSSPDLFASIGITAAPKFKEPIANKSSSSSSYSPLDKNHHHSMGCVSKVHSLVDEAASASWGEDDDLDIDSD